MAFLHKSSQIKNEKTQWNAMSGRLSVKSGEQIMAIPDGMTIKKKSLTNSMLSTFSRPFGRDRCTIRYCFSFTSVPG